MMNQTHYNSQYGLGPLRDTSYLNVNQSSVLMNYQTGLNQSTTTHDKSYQNHTNVT